MDLNIHFIGNFISNRHIYENWFLSFGDTRVKFREKESTQMISSISAQWMNFSLQNGINEEHVSRNNRANRYANKLLIF